MFSRRNLFKGIGAVVAAHITPNVSPAATSAAETTSASAIPASSPMILNTSWMDHLDPRETPILNKISLRRAIDSSRVEWIP